MTRVPAIHHHARLGRASSRGLLVLALLALVSHVRGGFRDTACSNPDRHHVAAAPAGVAILLRHRPPLLRPAAAGCGPYLAGRASAPQSRARVVAHPALRRASVLAPHPVRPATCRSPRSGTRRRQPAWRVSNNEFLNLQPAGTPAGTTASPPRATTSATACRSRVRAAERRLSCGVSGADGRVAADGCLRALRRRCSSGGTGWRWGTFVGRALVFCSVSRPTLLGGRGRA